MSNITLAPPGGDDIAASTPDTTPYALRQDGHPLLNAAMGVIFITVGLFSACLQILLLVVLQIYDDYRKRLSFRIISLVGVVNLIMLFGHSYEGLIRAGVFPSPLFVEKCFGAVMRGGSDSCYTLELLLAVNRYMIIRKRSSAVTNSKRTEAFDRYIYAAFFSASSLFFVVPVGVYMTPYCNVLLRDYSGTWVNEYRCVVTAPFSYLRHAEKISKASCCVAAFVLYTLIIVDVIKQRQFISDSSKSACRLRLDDVEVNILIYSLTMFVVSFSSLLFGYFSVSVIHSYLSEMFWLLACSLRAFFLPVLNRQLRKRFLLHFVGGRKECSSRVKFSQNSITVRTIVTDFVRMFDEIHRYSSLLTKPVSLFLLLLLFHVGLSAGLSCFSCQFSFNDIYDAINAEDGFCANRTLLSMSAEEVVKPCSSVDKYCATVITAILGSFTSINRGCSEHCSSICESVGYGQDQVICTDCCKTNNCNSNHTIDYYRRLMDRQHVSWTRPAADEVAYNRRVGAVFPYGKSRKPPALTTTTVAPSKQR